MMNKKTALVVTSIASPNAVLNALAQGSIKHGLEFIVIGDESSPSTFELEGARFYGIDEQRALPFRFAEKCPTRHYARKNIGYLVAISEGAEQIVETDDDNMPTEDFWTERVRRQSVKVISDAGWVNVYRYFTDTNIWPRGWPLDHIQAAIPPFESLVAEEIDCPIQQGLADENPDFYAIYRLALPLPQSFRKDRRVVLDAGTWSPFNSQNTSWWRDAFPLLYLPAYCSFRMTDIWRSFVAQRISWANNWGVLFHEPTVWQERNEHNLMRDFKDEVPGYLHNASIREALGRLELRPGASNIPASLRACYAKLVEMTLVGERELELLDAWLEDLTAVGF